MLNPASDLAQAEVKEMAEIILLGDVPDGQRSAPWKLRPRWILETNSQALTSTSMACGLKLEMLNRDLQTGAWGRGGMALQEAV